MTSPIFELADEFITAQLKDHPVHATFVGVESDRDFEDLGPAQKQADHERDKSALARLRDLPSTGKADDLARLHMSERLEAGIAAHESGEWMRELRAPFGFAMTVNSYLQAIPRSDDESWSEFARRAEDFGQSFSTYRETLDTGLAAGKTAARRQAVEAAAQARTYISGRSFDKFAAEYGDGPLKEKIATALETVYSHLDSFATYLENDYAPKAPEADGVGEERYRVNARLLTGADLDPREAYDWGWEELARIEAEMDAEAEKILPGEGLDAVIDHLYKNELVHGLDAYRAWLEETHETAFRMLDGVHFDIDPRLRSLDIDVQTDSNSGAASYMRPSEDLSRPGKTNWPVRGRESFATWDELTTVFHEGVPGHHLQIGQLRVVGDGLSRFSKMHMPSSYTEGWALYAERLADELGWFETPATRLGMLTSAAVRAARVVIDIGIHCGYKRPDGSEWTFESAREFLVERGRIAADRARPEIVRYCGWPGQAICYKLGERAWIAGRDEAKRRQGAAFDLKTWHTNALNAGPVGLDNLTELLADA
ncbi:DUF885 domain-containing protein [Salininema proteolyticum]|uniref:DUF885 domain-containing protein n=1 Tax=Salininema proteolyticum TaxID=1607685 RepID=A0ABV8U2N3_9ACTN